MVFETEHRGAVREADHVDPEDAHQIQFDFAQHLVGLRHLHWSAGGIEAKRLAKFVNGIDLHPGYGGRAEVQWNAVSLLMI